MSAPRICALPDCDKPVERSNQAYCCQQHRQLAYVREKRRQTVGKGLQDASDAPGGLPDVGTVDNASSASRHHEEWPSWLEAPLENAPVYVTVRGNRVKLDFVAPNFDEFDKCRQLKALGLSGRIGFRADTGTIGIVTTIDGGAKLTVKESSSTSAKFAKWEPFDKSKFEDK